MRPSLRVLLGTFTIGLALACGGGRPTGAECTTSDQCADPGACLNGVCSGYDCAVDGDCANDQVCGDVDGLAVCVTPCTKDAECSGTQTCRSVDGADGYCM